MLGRAVNDRVVVVVKLRVVDRKAGRKASKVRVANILEGSICSNQGDVIAVSWLRTCMLQRNVQMKERAADDARERSAPRAFYRLLPLKTTISPSTIHMQYSVPHGREHSC